MQIYYSETKGGKNIIILAQKKQDKTEIIKKRFGKKCPGFLFVFQNVSLVKHSHYIFEIDKKHIRSNDLKSLPFSLEKILMYCPFSNYAKLFPIFFSTREEKN